MEPNLFGFSRQRLHVIRFRTLTLKIQLAGLKIVHIEFISY